MAISHLLRLQSASHINRIGTLRARVLYSSLPSDGSSEKKALPKKSQVAKERKAQAVESFVEKYMKENQGVFPKATYVQNEVGGSWYNLKGMLQNVKEKFMRKFEEKNHSDAFTSTSDPKVCSGIPSHKVDDNSGYEPQIHEHAVQADTTAISNAMSSLDGQSSSLNVQNSESSELDCALKVPLAVGDAKTDCKNEHLQFDSLSYICGKSLDEDMVQETYAKGGVKTEKVSLDSEVVLGSSEHQKQDKTLQTSAGVNANKCNQTRSGNLPSFIKTSTNQQSLNLESETGPTVSSSEHSQNNPRVVDIFRKPKSAVKEWNQKMESEEMFSALFSVMEDSKSRSDEVSLYNSLLPRKATEELQDLVVDESGNSGYKYSPPEDNPSSLRTRTSAKMDKHSCLSDDAREMIQLKHHPVNSVKDQAAEGIANAVSDAYLPSCFQQSSKPSRDIAGGSSGIEALMDCVKAMPQPSVDRHRETIICSKSDHSSDRTATTVIQRSGNKPTFEKKERLMSSNMPKSDKKEGKPSSLYYPSMVEKNDIGGPFKKPPGYLTTEDQETSCTAALDCNKSKSNTQTEVLPLRDNGNLNKTMNATSFLKESDQNKVIVRFVDKSAECENIIGCFQGCGDVLKVSISSTEGDFYNTAYIYFESDEGMKKALKRTDVVFRNQILTVKAASSKDVKKTCIPDLIGHPDVATALVKNPKRTVMITKLADNITFHHIEEALSFCKSKISQLFLGSSSNVAYVEFETEEGKENALRRHSIKILGRKLLILRVDIPRTTVVRVSNLVHRPNKQRVISHCRSIGKTRHISHRNEQAMDVHFTLAEWPNMVTILNRLNMSEVDGRRLIAEPAPVYPPDVLDALWSQPEGRQHLRSAFHNLLKNFREYDLSAVGRSELIDSLFEDGVGS